MGNIRHSRTLRRQKKILIRIQERDKWILHALAKMRFLTTTHLAHLYFGDRKGMATKRLRKLFDAGLIRVWVRDLAKDNIYGLDRTGVRLLEDKDRNNHAYAVVRGLDGNLDHLLGINTVRVSLASGLPDVGGALISWRSDWEISRRTSHRIVPDAEFTIQWEGLGRQSFRLEFDGNSRSVEGFLKKMLRYDALGYGRSPSMILVVGKNQNWVHRYKTALCQMHGASPVWFTTLASIEDKGAVSRIWNHTRDEKHHALRECITVRH